MHVLDACTDLLRRTIEARRALARKLEREEKEQANQDQKAAEEEQARFKREEELRRRADVSKRVERAKVKQKEAAIKRYTYTPVAAPPYSFRSDCLFHAGWCCVRSLKGTKRKRRKNA